jgi:hypothetical protein
MAPVKRQIIDAMDELYSFLHQGSISMRNIERVKVLTRHPDDGVRSLAEVILEIARVKPHRRRRIRLIAENHWDLFVRMVSVLGDGFWDEIGCDLPPAEDWFQERWDKAKAEARARAYAGSPCWCGSGRPYWHCCAERDDVTVREIAEEMRHREEQALDAASLPWWHPDSSVDHHTRSAYEMFHIDPDHPLAIPPPEWRDEKPGPARQRGRQVHRKKKGR